MHTSPFCAPFIIAKNGADCKWNPHKGVVDWGVYTTLPAMSSKVFGQAFFKKLAVEVSLQSKLIAKRARALVALRRERNSPSVLKARKNEAHASKAVKGKKPRRGLLPPFTDLLHH